MNGSRIWKYPREMKKMIKSKNIPLVPINSQPGQMMEVDEDKVMPRKALPKVIQTNETENNNNNNNKQERNKLRWSRSVHGTPERDDRRWTPRRG